MLTDNFQKFCDCFYAPIYPLSPITSIGNEWRKVLGKNAFLLRMVNENLHLWFNKTMQFKYKIHLTR